MASASRTKRQIRNKAIRAVAHKGAARCSGFLPLLVAASCPELTRLVLFWIVGGKVAVMSRVLPATLEVVRQQLNQFLQNAEARSDDWVVMTSLVEADGSPNSAALNRIVMLMTNIQRETGRNGPPGSTLELAVDLGFIANFPAAHYPDGLTALSLVIACLQRQPLLTPSSHPELDRDLEKVSLELINQSAADLNHLFGMLGVKYQPSVFYRLRLLPYRAEDRQARALPVRGGGQEPPSPRR